MGFFNKINDWYLKSILSVEDSYLNLQNQEKIRKSWLIALCLFTAQSVLALPLMYFFGLLESNFTWAFNMGSPLFAFWLISLYLFMVKGISVLPVLYFSQVELDFTLSFFWIFNIGSALFSFLLSYIFIYKKKGIVFLMFSTTALLQSLIFDLEILTIWTGPALFILALSIGMKVYYGFHCMRLYHLYLYKRHRPKNLIYIEEGDPVLNVES